MDERNINIFEEIFNTVDSVLDDDEADSLKIIGSVLTLPDEQFELIKPALFESTEQLYNSPDVRIAFAQMLTQNHIKLDDLRNNMDSMMQAVSELSAEGIELSESKKDYLKFIFTTFINSMETARAISNRIITIPVEVCREDAKLPTYATDGSAAMDIYATEEYTIGPGEEIMIPTGLKVSIPNGYALIIQPRSGLSRKTKLRIPNTPGLIDSDYHEEICVLIENIDPPIKEVDEDEEGLLQAPLYGSSYTIGKGERFAQMRLIEVPIVNWLPVKSLGEFENDHGSGFGSSGQF